MLRKGHDALHKALTVEERRNRKMLEPNRITRQKYVLMKERPTLSLLSMTPSSTSLTHEKLYSLQKKYVG